MTCGTSQINGERLDELGVRYDEIFLKKLLRSDQTILADSASLEGLDPLLADFLKLHRSEGASRLTRLNHFYVDVKNTFFEQTPALSAAVEPKCFVETVMRYFTPTVEDPELTERTEKLGAELATLGVMIYTEEREITDRFSFMPGQDRITLLWSDTLAGAFCVSIVRQFLLEKKWVPEPTYLRAIRIEGLTERVDIPMQEIADRRILQAVKEAVSNSPPVDEHVLVYSGGFKSVIPMLTLYARPKKINLYCLFENSTILRRTYFRPDSEVESQQSFYRGKETSDTPVGLDLGPTT